MERQSNYSQINYNSAPPSGIVKKMKIEKYIMTTDSRHADFVDSFAYMIAAQEANLKNEYFLLYIRNKPKWLPKFIYEWIISKLLVTASFKKF